MVQCHRPEEATKTAQLQAEPFVPKRKTPLTFVAHASLLAHTTRSKQMFRTLLVKVFSVSFWYLLSRKHIDVIFCSAVVLAQTSEASAAMVLPFLLSHIG